MCELVVLVVHITHILTQNLSFVGILYYFITFLSYFRIFVKFINIFSFWKIAFHKRFHIQWGIHPCFHKKKSKISSKFCFKFVLFPDFIRKLFVFRFWASRAYLKIKDNLSSINTISVHPSNTVKNEYFFKNIHSEHIWTQENQKVGI